nr:USP6 N terminal protein [Hymenolepis microstoma]
MPGSLKSSNSTKRIIDKYNLSKSQANLATHFDEQEAQNNISYLDYFGFYHPDGLTQRDQEVEHKYRKKDIKRVDKWMKFIQNNGFDSFYKGKPNEELIRRVFKGIPPPIRPRVWPILLNVASAKKDRVYDDMRKYAFASSTYIQQIDLDINRTFRSTTFFNESFGPRQQVLFRILSAYSMYNTEVGYCQGMSDIAGMLLIYIMDEEEAFWAFAQLLDSPRHKMHCLFVRDFPGLHRYFTHHERVLKTHLRKIWKHFRKEQIDTSTYAFKWYMQCFLGRLPISLTLRIWDIYLLEGEKAMVAMAYNILKMHKQRLLRMDQMQVFAFLQDEISKDFGFTDDDVIDSLKDCLEDLRRSNLETPPPLTPDMLPTKPMGQTMAIWEVRHSDDEDQSKKEQQQNVSRSQKSKTEDSGVGTNVTEKDDVLRSDYPISTGSTAGDAAKPDVRSLKHVVSSKSTATGSSFQHSPLSMDSRRRLRGSQQSVSSTLSVVTSPQISTDTASVSSVNPHHHHSLPKRQNASRAPKTTPNESSGKNKSTPTSLRRVKNGKVRSPIKTFNVTRVDSVSPQDSEDVWFVPSGTGYVSNSGTNRAVDRKDVKKHNPNDDLNLPPRDYKSEDYDSNSPWMQAKPPPPTHHKSRQDTSSNENTVIVMHPAVSSEDPSAQSLRESSPLWTKNPSHSSSSPQSQSGVTKIGNAEVYAINVQRPVSSGCGPAFLPKGGNSPSIVFHTGGGELRWSVHGAISALPYEMPPRVCSPLYSPSPSPRSYQFQQYQ